MTVVLNGGPADGRTLALRRAPDWMRVVVAPDGKVDALDQIYDVPQHDERIYVYERVGPRSMAHVCIRGRGAAAGGWYATASYQALDDVDGEQLREAMAWRQWQADRAGVPLQVVMDALAAEAAAT